jgi:hypothetical protein
VAWPSSARILAAAAAVLLVAQAPWPAKAAPEQAAEVGLECRLASGPWQRCRMEVERIGSRWWLLVGDQRIDFRHDGRGSVQMQRSGSGWQPVTARWNPDTSLCWDGVCARGDLPLD